jgi:hypothetical protein
LPSSELLNIRFITGASKGSGRIEDTRLPAVLRKLDSGSKEALSRSFLGCDDNDKGLAEEESLPVSAFEAPSVLYLFPFLADLNR